MLRLIRLCSVNTMACVLYMLSLSLFNMPKNSVLDFTLKWRSTGYIHYVSFSSRSLYSRPKNAILNAVRHIILCFHNYKERIIIITKFCLKPHDNYSTPFEAGGYLYVKAVSHVTYDTSLLQYGHTHCDNQSFLPLPTEISQAKSPPTP